MPIEIKELHIKINVDDGGRRNAQDSDPFVTIEMLETVLLCIFAIFLLCLIINISVLCYANFCRYSRSNQRHKYSKAEGIPESDEETEDMEEIYIDK